MVCLFVVVASFAAFVCLLVAACFAACSGALQREIGESHEGINYRGAELSPKRFACVTYRFLLWLGARDSARQQQNIFPPR